MRAPWGLCSSVGGCVGGVALLLRPVTALVLLLMPALLKALALALVLLLILQTRSSHRLAKKKACRHHRLSLFLLVFIAADAVARAARGCI